MKLKNNPVFIILVLLLIAFITHFTWINSSLLTSGDWSFTFTESFRKNINIVFTWVTFGTGVFSIQNSAMPYLFLIHILSNFIDLQIILKLFFFYLILISPIFSFLLGYYFFRKNILIGFIFSISFFYNTYTILLHNGHLTLAVVNALFPLFLLIYYFALEKKSSFYLVILILSLFFIGGYDFRIIYVCLVTLLLYTMIYSFYTKKHYLCFKYFSIVTLLFILLNSFWLFYPLFIPNGYEAYVSPDRGLFGNSFSNINHAITTHHSFWNGSKIIPFMVQPIKFYFWLIPLLAFSSLIFFQREKNNFIKINLLFFLIVALLGIFLTKQVGLPFKNFYSFLFNHLPGFSGFREASKFYFLINFGYAGLISYATYNIHSYLKKRFKPFIGLIFVLSVCLLFLWNAKPLITGEIEGLFVERHIPSDYLILKNFTLQQDEYWRTFYIPKSPLWAIYTNKHPRLSIVDIFPNLLNISNISIKGNKGTAYYAISLFYQNISNNFLDQLSIKYVILPLQEIESEDDVFSYYGNRSLYLDGLKNISYLKKIYIGTKELIIYENENYRPHIYLTKDKETVYKNLNYKKVDFIFKNPTKYEIKIENVSQNFYLNFVESYNKNWKLYLGKFNWLSILRTKNNLFPDNFHNKSDLELNSFMIDLDYIKANYPKEEYTINHDGSLNFKLTLYFIPQTYFYLGLIISGITLMGCIFYLIFKIVIIFKVHRT